MRQVTCCGPTKLFRGSLCDHFFNSSLPLGGRWELSVYRSAVISFKANVIWSHFFYKLFIFRLDLFSQRGGVPLSDFPPCSLFSEVDFKKKILILFPRFGTGGLGKVKNHQYLVKKRKHIHCTSRTNSSLTVFS